MYISTKLECFTQHKQNNSLPIFVINKDNFKNWLSRQDNFLQNYVKKFDEKRKIITIPGSLGNIQKVICLVYEDMFSIADLPNQLIQGNYHIEHADITDLSLYYIGFALGSYKFKKYKSKTQQTKVKLFLPQQYQYILATIEANYLVRDMITTPAEDMDQLILLM